MPAVSPASSPPPSPRPSPAATLSSPPTSEPPAPSATPTTSPNSKPTSPPGPHPPSSPSTPGLPTLHHQLILSGAASSILLNRTQIHTLWRDLIAADPQLSTLRPLDTLADLAARAWHLLHLHNGDLRHPDFAASTDTRAFQRWAIQFDRLCTRHQYITPDQLPAILTQAITTGSLTLSTPAITLIDFDHHPPAHQTLFQALRTAGIPVHSQQSGAPGSTPSPSPPGLIPQPNPRTEIQAAAHWAANLLTQSPQTRIAIVVPNLADQRPQIDRISSTLLTPTQYEFSLGQPLAQTALAATALDLIRWTLEPLPLTRISTLLLSPFLTPIANLTATAEFDATILRQLPRLRPELSLQATIEYLSKAPRLTTLRTQLRALLSESIPDDLQQSHADHADSFRNLLNAAGWSTLAQSDSLAFPNPSPLGIHPRRTRHTRLPAH